MGRRLILAEDREEEGSDPLNAKRITDKRLISLIYKKFTDIEKVKDNNSVEKQ